MESFTFDAHTTTYSPINALWLAKASQLAYQKEPTIQQQVKQWGFAKFFFIGDDATGAEAWIAGKEDIIFVVFRGTDEAEDWRTNTRLAQTLWKTRQGEESPYYPSGMVHRGFAAALDRIWYPISERVNWFRDQNQTLWVSGHSLGGALASLSLARFREENIDVRGAYTFGQPRVFNRRFAKQLDADFQSKYFRFVNNNDVICRVPFLFNYAHGGTLRYFNAQGQLLENMPWWQRAFDRVYGRFLDLGEPGTDGFKDHDIELYIQNLKKNL
ncbi:lipase family protein [Geitlerinema sp. PCC 9228]|jgi:triacylglycerol lipase|uniref:lipase family protein n=1 Tax=Geitlerinema sp. PCC 9228 TaxID=111611 RepID=UPI0008F9CD06|nr:lipase family protein [Geitlerinema sp. PCC 9228]